MVSVSTSELLVTCHHAPARRVVGPRPQRWLSAAEAQSVGQFTNRVRRIEWLRGRALAKFTVCGSLPDSVPASAWEIVTDPAGAPSARRAGQPEARVLSLSHSGPWTVCGTSLHAGRLGLGVDVENVAPRLVELAPRFATNEEIEWAFAQYGGATGATLLWSVKEAAIKASGAHTLRRRSFHVSGESSHRFRISAPGLHGERVTLFGGLAHLEGYVLTWVSTEERSVRLRRLPSVSLAELTGCTEARQRAH